MNSSYIETVKKYKKEDAQIALLLYTLLIVAYIVGGLFDVSIFGVRLIFLINLVFPIACIVIVMLRKQGLSSIGITKQNALKSLLAGTVAGVLFIFVASVIPAILFGWAAMPIFPILISLCYQLFIIVLSEEIIFRGYIQTRLYGIAKNDISAVLTGAVLFALFHAPYQLASGRKSAADIFFYVWLLSTFVYHILFNMLFRKYNAIYASVVFHALGNITGILFDTGNAPEWYNYYTFSIPFVIAIILGIVTLTKRKKVAMTPPK